MLTAGALDGLPATAFTFELVLGRSKPEFESPKLRFINAGMNHEIVCTRDLNAAFGRESLSQLKRYGAGFLAEQPG